MHPRVPTREEVQIVISALLVARKEATTTGVPVAALDSDYREQEGIRIPYRQLGYSCLLDFLYSLSSALSVRSSNGMHVVFPIVSDKSAHVSSLVARQKTSFNRRPRGGRRPMRPSPWYPRVIQPPRRLDSRILNDIVKLARKRPDGVHRDEILQYIRDRLNYSFEPEDLKLQLREVNHEIVVERDMIYPISNYETPSYVDNSRALNNNVEASTVHCAIRAAGDSDDEDDDEEFCAGPFVNSVAQNGKATPSSGNANDSNNNDKVEINRREAEAQTNGNAAERPEGFETVVDREDCEGYENGDLENIGMLIISERTKFRLEKLMQSHPEGIWCAELPDLYYKEYKVPLNYEELGFGSVSDFAAYLPDIFYMVQLKEKGDFKLFDAKTEKPNLKQSKRQGSHSLAVLYNIYEGYGQETELPVPIVLPKETSQRLVPDGVMPLGETVPQICVTELTDYGIKEYLNVKVVDIFTPSFFWIHLLERTVRFTQFMNDLHAFYSQHAKKYLMPIIIMEKGMNCACIYDGKWHRGIIKTVKHDNTVTILFYDYGTVHHYPPEEIYFLHRSFSALPAQAIPCGLYNIRPKETDKWLKSVTVEFTWKVLEIPLVAEIATVDPENNSMLIGLTNTEGEEDFHITDWMIHKGYAECGKMGDTVDMNDTSYDPTYVEVSCCQPPSEGVHRGQSLGALSTIVEEPNSIGVDNNALWKMIDEMRLKIEMLTTKLDDQSRTLQKLQTPPIPPMPEKPAIGFSSESQPLVTFANGDDNLPEEEEASITNLEHLMPVPAPPMIGQGDANMNFTSTTSYECPVYAAAQSWSRGPFSAYEPQIAPHSNYDYSNQGLPSVASQNRHLEVPTVATPFKFGDIPLNESQIFQFGAPKNDSMQRKKFEQSVTDTVSSAFERLEKRAKAKASVAPTEFLHDSNPFKIDLGFDDTRANKREQPAPLSQPPPLPPRSVAKKPWEDLMQMDIQNQRAEAATKVVYEAAPFMYETSTKGANDPRSSAPVSNKREDLAAANQAKRNSVLDNGHYKTKSEDFGMPNGRAFSFDTASSHLPSDFNFSKRQNETPEERNLRMFNESCAAEQARLSRFGQTATSVGPKSPRAMPRKPPPLPPRKYFDFNAMTHEEQARYTDWLKTAELSDNFENEESLASSGWQRTRGDDEGAVGYSRTAEFTAYREATRAEPAYCQSKNGEMTPRQENETKRDARTQLEDPGDPCRFTAYELPDRTVYIFHVDDEGWLATEEFAAAFTNLHAPAMVKILQELKVTVPYRSLNRTEHIRFFEKLDRTSLGVPRDESNKIGDVLHLTPLKSAFRILRKLKITTEEEQNRMKKDKVFPDKSPVLLRAFNIVQEYIRYQQSLKLLNGDSKPM